MRNEYFPSVVWPPGWLGDEVLENVYQSLKEKGKNGPFVEAAGKGLERAVFFSSWFGGGCEDQDRRSWVVNGKSITSVQGAHWTRCGSQPEAGRRDTTYRFRLIWDSLWPLWASGVIKLIGFLFKVRQQEITTAKSWNLIWMWWWDLCQVWVTFMLPNFWSTLLFSSFVFESFFNEDKMLRDYLCWHGIYFFLIFKGRKSRKFKLIWTPARLEVKIFSFAIFSKFHEELLYFQIFDEI